MAKKIVAIICGVSWAMFLIPMAVMEPYAWSTSVVGDFSAVAGYLAFCSTPVLAIMALIDYARRPR